jgi:hypothetical protein
LGLLMVAGAGSIGAQGELLEVPRTEPKAHHSAPFLLLCSHFDAFY